MTVGKKKCVGYCSSTNPISAIAHRSQREDRSRRERERGWTAAELGRRGWRTWLRCPRGRGARRWWPCARPWASRHASARTRASSHLHPTIQSHPHFTIRSQIPPNAFESKSERKSDHSINPIPSHPISRFNPDRWNETYHRRRRSWCHRSCSSREQ